jgi:glyoxylase-like metal-dependent hydrolase (beta-lactamase superfamily II)
VNIIKLTRNTEVIPGSPNTLIYDGRIVIDQGGRNASLQLNGEVQLATHGHSDHIAGLTRSAKAKYLPPEDYWSLTLMGRRAMTYGFSSRDSPIFTFDLVKQNLELNFSDPEVEVIKLPGHTPGHVAYLLGDVLYAGDSFFGQRVIEGFGVPFYTDFWAAMESLNKLRELVGGVEKVVISHGPTYLDSKKATELIEFNINYCNKLVEKVRELIMGRELTAEEVAYQVSINKDPANIYLNSIPIKSILVQVAGNIRTTEKGVAYSL